MGISREYYRDGHLFLVEFPVSNIKSLDDRLVVYTDQSGNHERRFSKHSELVKFINWLGDNNA